MRGAIARARFVLRAAARGLAASATTSSVAVVTMALALVLAGAFALVLGNMQGLVERMGDALTLSAYLGPGLDQAAQAEAARSAARIDGVLAAEPISRDEALARFPERTGIPAAVAELLDENPLPASIEVRLRADRRVTGETARIRAALEAIPGVTDVSAGDDWVPAYERALAFVRSVGLAVGLVLSLSTLVIVASTVRLTLLARRDELEILSLVGASRSTLRLPFLLEGAAQGAAAGLLALALLRGLFLLAQPAVEAELAFLAGPGAVAFFSAQEGLALVAGGALLGLLGAAVSVAADARV